MIYYDYACKKVIKTKFFCLIGYLERELDDLKEVLYHLQREGATKLKPFPHTVQDGISMVSPIFFQNKTGEQFQSFILKLAGSPRNV